ncbi:MAG: 30S ribosomal protein S27ae [Thermoprotei archaeon]|nr:30S ribosomal protein S27ae [Thermoprotei archaeon]
MASAHRRYEYDYATGTIRLKNRTCPRCGRIMAYHKEPVARWYCGYCHYTEFLREGGRSGRREARSR